MNYMREIAALELAILAKELREFDGFYIDKFYEESTGSFRMRLSKGGKRENLRIMLKVGAWRTSSIETGGGAPTNFAMAVRSRLRGFHIENAGQMAGDRVLEFRLSNGKEAASLIVEMMGRGNLIITDSSMKITLAYSVHVFRDRSIRPGAAYVPPKNDSVDYGKLDPEIRLRFQDAGKEASLISFLTKNINIGALYIEEALRRAGINPKDKISSIQEEQIERILLSIDSVVRESEAGSYYMYAADGRKADFSVCSISKYSGLKRTELGSVQALLDDFYADRVEEEADNTQVEELESSIAKQRELMRGMDEKIASYKNAGEAILNNMGRINMLIDELKRRRRATKEELQEMFPDIVIKELDLKGKKITIGID